MKEDLPPVTWTDVFSSLLPITIRGLIIAIVIYLIDKKVISGNNWFFVILVCGCIFGILKALWVFIVLLFRKIDPDF